MLMGEFERSIDAKGRLIIPAKFREQLGASFVLTRGMDGCLFGYPIAEWDKLQAKLATLPLAKKMPAPSRVFFFRPRPNVKLTSRDGSIFPSHCSNMRR
ncbi:Protein MraZ [Lactobacillus casei W56] [Lacticaseibacillus rhamnosus]|nr:Protein MraZ [Lactobacillus casei W56] [Lacticaseibacillus rhamnosus]